VPGVVGCSRLLGLTRLDVGKRFEVRVPGIRSVRVTRWQHSGSH